FAYVAAHPARFQKKLLVEYLPALDPKKGNRLWDLLGQKFTGLSYREADRLSSRSKEFILSLFPKEKIYTCLLPGHVVRDLGTPGPGARKSVGMLQKIGFRFLRQIDPFDGGPHFGALTKNVTLVRRTRRLVWGEKLLKAPVSARSIFLSENKGDVRAVLSDPSDPGTRTLDLKKGDTFWATPF
ncbi:MAG TPA: arginine N-succinyltransferase, partial [Candidatus Omnitrophota bacterium]|nr:arginine N-succinyltransferase [Candidatus Omnitrophota bacterium]